MDKLPDVLARKLTRLGSKLIDQQRGRLLVQPTEDADGSGSAAAIACVTLATAACC